MQPYLSIRIRSNSGEKILKKREIRTEDKAKRVMIRGNGWKGMEFGV